MKLSAFTCDAADLWQTHHDLGEAFGLVRVLVLGVVLTHIPVALVQLLQLGGVGQSSDICRHVNDRRSHVGNTPRVKRSHNGACVATLVEEVDGFHTGILLITDLQLVELAKQINQPLHDFHPILAEAEERDRLVSSDGQTPMSLKYSSCHLMVILKFLHII